MNERTHAVSDSHLITSTSRVISALRKVDLTLLEHLAAIEARELHLKSGYSSLFKMCTEHFHLSEAALAVAGKRALGPRPIDGWQLPG